MPHLTRQLTVVYGTNPPLQLGFSLQSGKVVFDEKAASSLQRTCEEMWNSGNRKVFLWRIKGESLDTLLGMLGTHLEQGNVTVEIRDAPHAVPQHDPRRHRGTAQAGMPGRCPRTTPRVRQAAPSVLHLNRLAASLTRYPPGSRRT